MKILILLLTFYNCITIQPKQVLIRKNNPMPNEVIFNGDPSQKIITKVANGKFRDASIHVGSESSIVMHNHQRGLEAFAILEISAIPSKDMLNTNLEDFDLNEYDVVEIIGNSAGCATGVTLYIPVGNKDNKQFIPVSFSFSKESFYSILSKKMEAEKIEALFDSRLDKERESYIFGFFRKECIRFRSLGLRKKVQ